MPYSKHYALDASTGLIKRAPAQAALTSDGWVGSQYDQGAATATDMVYVMVLESIVTNGATGETYDFRIVGSNVADRSDGEILASIKIGKASVIGTGETRDAVAADRIVLPFRTEKRRAMFRYVDVYLDVAGTSPSIAFQSYFSKEIC